MSVEDEQVFNFRDWQGINLNINARIVNPQKFKLLRNLWAPFRGRLEQVPGQNVFADKIFSGPAQTLFEATEDPTNATDPLPGDLTPFIDPSDLVDPGNIFNPDGVGIIGPNGPFIPPEAGPIPGWMAQMLPNFGGGILTGLNRVTSAQKIAAGIDFGAVLFSGGF